MNKNVYTRPAKPDTMIVTRRKEVQSTAPPPLPEPIAVHKTTECHVTPDHIADYMVDVLEATQDQLTLEPSCGTGSLAYSLLKSGHSRYELTMIEQSSELCRATRKRLSSFGDIVDPINQCFLEYAKQAQGKIEFSRIIMNPPFRKIKAHMDCALSLLGYDGHANAILVALVPSTYEHEEAELIDILPDDTFPTAKVHTKIIRIQR